jgi:hypothetical protein
MKFFYKARQKYYDVKNSEIKMQCSKMFQIINFELNAVYNASTYRKFTFIQSQL